MMTAPKRQGKDDSEMKKIIALMTALVLVTGLCAFANAEGVDISALTVTSPSGAPALATAERNGA